ncbi:MAG TPA: Rieske (2Fe-2S) protein [Acetobacteraceae bacterium]|jgi:nitrite reductase/ring-hydroxylating ferredoxin subunit|nr:Rieske (2Fe-2S) protein [Acetobacteraceae bacterium]
MVWIDALPAAELAAKRQAVVRHDGRQILVLQTDRGVLACANRCPHEGYPLSEGVLTNGRVLTCNWHNWKFDLVSGETLVGGDRLPRFETRVADGRVWLDIEPIDPAVRRREILAGVITALNDLDQERMVREVARLVRLDADPLDAVRAAVAWVADRLEFGTTHAIAGAPDWIEQFDDPARDADRKLVALGEVLGHIADDARLSRRGPVAVAEAMAWDEAAFLAAIEREDEPGAVAHLRGALAAGVTAKKLLPALVTAALAHYADFGHSLIYAVKSVELEDRLGPASREPILLMLVRSLLYATREDLVPEFRDYAPALASWGGSTDALPLCPETLRGCGPKRAMAVAAGWSGTHPAETIFPVLVEAAAWMLLHVDSRVLTTADAKIADNVGWLDFTHALTFADAARTAVAVRPALWPAVLLQMACFIGRNSGYVDPAMDMRAFAVSDIESFVAEETEAVFDHGRDRFIISVHLLKTLRAGARLTAALPDQAPIIAAALNRFLHAPIKGRHTLRTARQMRELVAQE